MILRSLLIVATPYGMEWLRLVGSLKSYVSFAEYRLFYRALLQKRRIILRRLLIVATPYTPLACDMANNNVICAYDIHTCT